MSVLIEVAAGNLESVVAAAEGGADRIELCSALSAGGLTPSPGFALEARAITRLPIFAMIRPREGDFFYTETEFQSMMHDIRILKETGVDGFVFGALTESGRVDEENCKALLTLCNPLPVTFHRAFDRAADPMQSLEAIIALGFSRLLTSGQADTAWQGRSLIRELVLLAGDRIAILAGAGVSMDHARQLVEESGVKEIHLSAKRSRVRRLPAAHALTEDRPDGVSDPSFIRLLKQALG
ncbi:MAG: copper homeostasis protein CutC [Bacteroidia bacterium]|nr:copper homeostasis protein CutC [Bacteroidia bacterium]MBP7436203.1 copper homeostasis protein CutC [Bacteroidia bacterium]MBP7728253.1 copper homeostasis protein CutC [Bacteroidia bacterium]MBP7772548.1 copper homeostasis protein CutC [Bacteroidia bacterium]